MNRIEALRVRLAAAADRVLQDAARHRSQLPREQWEHEGGYCDEIADALADVLLEHGIDAVTQESAHGSQHTFVVAEAQDGSAVVVDVPFCVYEIERGPYTFDLVPGARIHPQHVVIEPLGWSFTEHTVQGAVPYRQLEGWAGGGLTTTGWREPARYNASCAIRVGLPFAQPALSGRHWMGSADHVPTASGPPSLGWSKAAFRNLLPAQLIWAAWHAVDIESALHRRTLQSQAGLPAEQHEAIFFNRELLDHVSQWLNGQLSSRQFLKRWEYASQIANPAADWLRAAVLREILASTGELPQSPRLVQDAAREAVEAAYQQAYQGREDTPVVDDARAEAFLTQWRRKVQALHRGREFEGFGPILSVNGGSPVGA